MPSGPNRWPSPPELSSMYTTGLPSTTLYVLLAPTSLKNTSPLALVAAPSVNLYPSPTSFQSSPGIRISRTCCEPSPVLTGFGQPSHSHFVASGNSCVACLPSCPPSPHSCLTS